MKFFFFFFTSHISVISVTEDYTEELAIAHIRRLLDIVACTASFGSSTSSSSSPKTAGRKDAGSKDRSGPVDQGSGSDNEKKQKEEAEKEKGDGQVSMCPPPRLGQFYDFFSFSHLTPPIQCELPYFPEKT